VPQVSPADPPGPTDAEGFNVRNQGRLPELIGVEVLAVEPGRLHARLELRPQLLAPNGFLHAGTVVTLADTACGYGCRANLPEGATGFTTLELKANFVGTAREGIVECEASLAHGGRTTQVWDATVTEKTGGRSIAIFRCTQLILYS
jgi:1,4-dihydroxy-2-naphthoyl-CoA hydrolase